MGERARSAMTTVSLPPASERLDIANTETALNRPNRAARKRHWLTHCQAEATSVESVLAMSYEGQRLSIADAHLGARERGSRVVFMHCISEKLCTVWGVPITHEVTSAI